jgi:PAS domain S-box-containing protein
VNTLQPSVSATPKTTTLINCFQNAVVLFKKDLLRSKDEIINVNNSAIKLFGYTRQEFLGISIQQIFHEITYAKIKDAKDLSNVSEGFCVDKENKVFPVEFYSNNTGTDEDTYLMVIKNITEKKENEQQLARYIEELHETKDTMERNAYELVVLNLKLEESEERLKELNASKDKLFSIIAHDLRSPFTSFIGLTELLSEDFDEMDPLEVKILISELNKTAKSVFGLLENLLSWSRLQTGRMEYNPEFISPVDIVNKTVNLFEGPAKQKKIRLTSQIFCVNEIYADRNMIETVLRNLVSNALKFTRENGEITVTLSGNEEQVEFSVKDSGVGIDEENLAKLFRLDKTHTTPGTNNEAGSGLGLILCKELVERNKGKIKVESDAGKGTNFSFSVPVKDSSSKE